MLRHPYWHGHRDEQRRGLREHRRRRHCQWHSAGAADKGEMMGGVSMRRLRDVIVPRKASAPETSVSLQLLLLLLLLLLKVPTLLLQ